LTGIHAPRDDHPIPRRPDDDVPGTPRKWQRRGSDSSCSLKKTLTSGGRLQDVNTEVIGGLRAFARF